MNDRVDDIARDAQAAIASAQTLDELDELIPISLGADLVNPVPPQPPRQ